jgi:hypothetical protein
MLASRPPTVISDDAGVIVFHAPPIDFTNCCARIGNSPLPARPSRTGAQLRSAKMAQCEHLSKTCDRHHLEAAPRVISVR